jgi:hypothetical protein
MPEDKRAPLVGQFSGPTGNAPRTPVELPRKPVIATGTTGADKLEEELSKAAEKTAEKASEDGDNTRPKTPQEKAQDYLKGLEAVGVSAVEARGILEKVLVNDVYEESSKMGPIQVTVRTRVYKDVMRTLRFLELEKPTYAMGINDVVARYNMAASLVEYNEQKFTFPTTKGGASDEEIENAFHERLAFVMELPVVAMNRLMQTVHNFDEKIAAVFAEGAPEDF